MSYYVYVDLKMMRFDVDFIICFPISMSITFVHFCCCLCKFLFLLFNCPSSSRCLLYSDSLFCIPSSIFCQELHFFYLDVNVPISPISSSIVLYFSFITSQSYSFLCRRTALNPPLFSQRPVRLHASFERGNARYKKT